ncbi:hypothetical protein FQA39_LY11937 [Lamprigera yunnana]|nr:hypothetical protein FQA39_LY11937 [Lamprigera yunnana]
MVSLFLVILLLRFVWGIELDGAKDAKTLSYEFKKDDPNKYYFKYETSNGISREETGEIFYLEDGTSKLSVHGTYSYYDSDNILQTRRYISDDQGYREIIPQGMIGLRIGKTAIQSLQGGGFG